MENKVSLRGVSLDTAVRAFVSRLMEIEREMGLSDDSISSSADKEIQSELDREISKIHIPTHLKDK